jgi:hypothetical protein
MTPRVSTVRSISSSTLRAAVRGGSMFGYPVLYAGREGDVFRMLPG